MACLSVKSPAVCLLKEIKFHLDNKGPALLAQEELDLISLAAVKWPTCVAGVPQMNHIHFLKRGS